MGGQAGNMYGNLYRSGDFADTGNTSTAQPSVAPAYDPDSARYRFATAGGGFLGQPPAEGVEGMPSQGRMYNRAYVGLNNPNMVYQAYQKLLGRPPDPIGGSFYNQQMMSGMTGQGLVGALTTSPEFQRQQEYNRAYTEAFRPGYKEFGPNKQYYQPIYQSRYTDYSTPMALFNQGINTAYAPSYSGFLGGFGNPPASSAASNTIGGIGTSGRLAAGGEVDDNPGDDDGIRALLGRQ